MLDPDIVEHVDTGSGTILEVRGAGTVARRAMAASRSDLVGRPALVNGAAGWIALLDGDVYAVAALTVRSGRITTMDILLAPHASPASTSPSSTPDHEEGQAWSCLSRRRRSR